MLMWLSRFEKNCLFLKCFGASATKDEAAKLRKKIDEIIPVLALLLQGLSGLTVPSLYRRRSNVILSILFGNIANES